MSKELTDFVKDPQSVTTHGQMIQELPEGVSFREIPTHVDGRGQLFEMFDERWTWDDKPLKYAYMTTMYPGIVKGWAMHKLHEDRYCIMFGHMDVILYDTRPESSTYGLLSKVTLSEYNRRLVNIPVRDLACGS